MQKKQSGTNNFHYLKWIYYLLDYFLGYIIKILPTIITKSHLFIMDRYYFDYYIDPKRTLIKLPEFIIKIGELFVPKPDLVICLGGDPEIIYNRKPETSLEEVTKQNEKLKKFALKRKNAIWIDTSISLNVSVEQTMTSIIDMMYKRFSTQKTI